MFDGGNGLLSSEESDSFDESLREELAADYRPEEPLEGVQVVMSVDMDHQVLVPCVLY